MSKIHSIKWVVRPISEQMVVRRCPKCGARRNFQPSGCFRVNAQKKLLDIWHVYKCVNCDDTWNVEIIARINCKAIDPDLYDSFIRNDTETARRYAYDYALLSRQKAVLADLPEIGIDGDDLKNLPSCDEVEIQIESEFSLPVRFSVVLSQKMGLSRRRIEKLIEDGVITGLDESLLIKKVPQNFSFRLKLEPVIKEMQNQIVSDARERDLAEKAKAKRAEEASEGKDERYRNPWRRKK